MSYQPYGKRKRYESYGMEAEDSFLGGINLNGLFAYFNMNSALDNKNNIVFTNHNGAVFDNFPPIKVGKYVNFDGASSQWLDATNSIYTLGNRDFTCHCWIKLDSKSINENHIISKGSIATGPDLDLSLIYAGSGSDFFQFLMGNSGAGGQFINCVANGLSPNIGQWYWLLAEYIHSTRSGKIYVDNILLNNVQNLSFPGPGNTSNKLALGIRGDTAGFGFVFGSVDEVGLWHRLLTAQEKLTIFSAQRSLL